MLDADPVGRRLRHHRGWCTVTDVQRIQQGHALAFHCTVCNGKAPWRIERYGDAVVSWACGPHLAAECAHLQRSRERTRLEVTLNNVYQDCDCPAVCDCGECAP